MSDVGARAGDRGTGTGAERGPVDRAAELRAAMVADLLERGALSPPWRHAVEQVARHEFIPDTIWTHHEHLTDRDYAPLRRGADPEQWLAAAYGDAAVVTQVDDGDVDAEGGGEAVTSSASMPAVVAEMLTALDIEPGMRVLEIGTGTGWNAALLAHRLGPENVVSIEIDPALAAVARANLERAGYGAVTVITAGDATAAARHGPYDRLIATVAAGGIPPAWIAQLRPGGIAVLPWGTDWYPCALLRMDVPDDPADAGSARGRIIGDAVFMQLRDQRVPRAILPAERRERHRDGESWARLHHTATAPHWVEQGGPRRLVDELATAYRWWQEHGEPERDRWVITVGPQGQLVELEPERPAVPGIGADLGVRSA